MRNAFVYEHGDDFGHRSGFFIYNDTQVCYDVEYGGSRNTNLILRRYEKEDAVERVDKKVKAEMDDVLESIEKMFKEKKLEGGSFGDIVKDIHKKLDEKYEVIKEMHLLDFQHADNRFSSGDGVKFVRYLGKTEKLYKEQSEDGLYIAEKLAEGLNSLGKYERLYFKVDFNIASYEVFEKQWKEEKEKRKIINDDKKNEDKNENSRRSR